MQAFYVIDAYYDDRDVAHKSHAHENLDWLLYSHLRSRWVRRFPLLVAGWPAVRAPNSKKSSRSCTFICNRGKFERSGEENSQWDSKLTNKTTTSARA